MKKQRKGISLIVLIVTIIVIVILAVTVILVVSKNNPIELAKEAVFKEDMRAYQDELNMYISKKYQESGGWEDPEISANKYTKNGESDSVYTYISSFKKKYENKIAIKKNQIAYIGLDDKERNWLLNSGVYMSKILTIKYVDGDGNKIADEEKISQLEPEYSIKAKEIIGYMPIQRVIEGVASSNIDIIFTYCKECTDLAFKGLDANGNETDEESNIISYEVTGIGECNVSKVAIPREYNGKPVTDIKDNAFRNNSTIKILIVGDNIEKIGEEAFDNCTGLEEITIDTKNNLSSSYILYGCSNLKKVILGKNISNLPYCLFTNCGKLETIIINTEQDITIGSRVFESCNSVKEILVNGGNTKYKSVDGVLYSKDGSKLVLYPLAKEGEEFAFDKNVKEIGNKAFEYNKKIKRMIVPNTVEKIGETAFQYCTGLEEITIDTKNNLSSSEILYGCSNLKKVTLGKNISNFPNCLFTKCGKLETIIINTEQDITIYGRVFESCNSVKEILVNEGNTKYKSVDGVLYSKDGSKLVLYPLAKEGEEFAFDKNVKEIGNSAFKYNKKIKRMIVPNTIEKIGEAAFEYCIGLEEITIDTKNNLSSSEILYGCSNLKKVTLGKNISNFPYCLFTRCSNLEAIVINTEQDITIGKRVFENCSSLKEILVIEGNTKYKSVDGVLYTIDGNNVVIDPNNL